MHCTAIINTKKSIQTTPGAERRANMATREQQSPVRQATHSPTRGFKDNMTSTGMIIDSFDEDGWAKIADKSVFHPPSTSGGGSSPPQTTHPIPYPYTSAKRLHACLNGRYISVIQYKEELHCLDSICFHSGGPLALGDIEDVGGQPCLKCPWHFYHVSLEDGEKWYQEADIQPDGTLKAGSWKSVGARQRRHDVEMRDDGVYVKLNLEGDIASDRYAFEYETGNRIMQHGDVNEWTLPHMQTSPGISAHSPRSTPPTSPRRSLISTESEDVWPEDGDVTSISPRRNHLQ